ncbi:VanZ family protein [Neolewinella aurantiaca]|uniref:VanZ family protein n=1 Tax=Neolewinella aurantiaca TaxID=2602767 RepID=A0A5C7FTP8_9BACT|nr:VanZ family protein [Neolewinella aurantiaca]
MEHPPKKYPKASSSRKQRIQWFASGAYTLFLIVVSLLPGGNVPSIPDWFSLFSPDKVAHFGAYGVFALLLSVTFSEGRIKWVILRSVFIAAGFGVLMEILQGISGTGRHFDPVDMVANLLGAVLGGLVYYLFKLLRKKTSATAADLND